MYAPFDVPRLLGRSLEVSITRDSGLAGLVYVLRRHLGIELSKDDPRLGALQDWVTGEFDGGRLTAIEWEELAPIVRRLFQDTTPAPPIPSAPPRL